MYQPDQISNGNEPLNIAWTASNPSSPSRDMYVHTHIYIHGKWSLPTLEKNKVGLGGVQVLHFLMSVPILLN